MNERVKEVIDKYGGSSFYPQYLFLSRIWVTYFPYNVYWYEFHTLGECQQYLKARKTRGVKIHPPEYSQYD